MVAVGSIFSARGGVASFRVRRTTGTYLAGLSQRGPCRGLARQQVRGRWTTRSGLFRRRADLAGDGNGRVFRKVIDPGDLEPGIRRVAAEPAPSAGG
jgi:hypothetical protein